MAIWTAKTSGTSLGLYSVAAKGTFVLAGIQTGTNRATTSNDGDTWSVVTSTPLRLGPIAANSTRFIAYSPVGTIGIYSSTDGSSWTFEESLRPTEALKYTNSKFMGIFTTSPFTAYTIKYSATGLNGSWTSNAKPSDCTTPRGVWYNGSLYFVCGTDSSGFGAIWTSPTLATWTKRFTSSNLLTIYDISHDGTGYACATNSQLSVTSTDGLSWTEGSVTDTDYIGSFIISAGAALYSSYTSVSYTYIVRSVDHGVTWTNDIQISNSDSFNAMCTYGSDKLVAVGLSGMLYGGLLVDAVATPSASPSSGSYTGDQSVTLSCATSGASIRYTTDGSTPSASSTLYTGAITISSTSSLKAIALKTGMDQSLILSAAYTITCATPTASPVAGTFDNNQIVVLSSATSGASIRYTTNGSTPTSGSSLYSSGLTVNSTTTIKAIALKTGAITSAVFSGTYTLTCATPVASPVAGSYDNTQSVTLSTTTSGASIRYTTDGSTPTGSSTLYAGALTISSTTTLKAIAIKAGYTSSSVLSSTYTLGTANPTFTPSSTDFSVSISVSISCATSASIIYYTTDGTVPTVSSTVYSAPFTVSSDTTVKALAIKSGFNDSAVVSISYVKTVDDPVISPAAGTYSNNQSASITCGTAGASIYYTLDGTAPDNTKTLYTGTISIGSTKTVKAIGIKAGNPSSSVVSSAFTLKCALPVASPTSGDHSSTFSVTLSTTTTSASIRYTTDGSTPTGSSTLYSGAVSIAGATVVKAIALKSGYSDSDVMSESYTFSIADPTNSLSAGTFNNSQVATLACATAGTTIRYTTDGSTPTGSSSAYSTPLTIDSSITLTIKAFKSGYTDSISVSRDYVFVCLTPSISIVGGTYSAIQDIALACGTTSASIRYTLDGTDPTTLSSLFSTNIQLGHSATLSAKAFKSGYTPSGISDEVYIIEGVPPSAATVSTPDGGGHYVVNDLSPSISITMSAPSGSIRYTTNGLDPTSSSTLYVGAISISSTTTFKMISVDPPRDNSQVATQTFTLKCDMPFLNPASDGSGTEGGSPAIPCTLKIQSLLYTLSGSNVYYTLDGTAPTVGSALYSASAGITINASNTLVRMLRTKSGLLDSDIKNQTIVQGVVSTPTSNRPTGNYRIVNVNLSNSSSPSSTIRYTLDGTTPTASSTPFTTTIVITTSTTLKAKAFHTGFVDSNVATFTYTIVPATEYRVGSTRPYLTIPLALAAVPADLTDTGVHEIIIDSGSWTQHFSILKSGASSDDHLIFKANSGDEWLGNPGNSVHIINDRTDPAYFQLSYPAYTELYDIVFEDFDVIGTTGCKAIRCGSFTKHAYGSNTPFGFQDFFEVWYGIHHVTSSLISSLTSATSFLNTNLTSGMLCVGCASNYSSIGFQASAGKPMKAVDCVAAISTSYSAGTKKTFNGSSITQYSCIGNDAFALAFPSVDPANFKWTDRAAGDLRIVQAQKDSSILIVEGTDPSPYTSFVQIQDIELDEIPYWVLGPDWEPIRCKPVTFDHDTSTLNNAFSLVLTTATVTPCQIRYTVDGTTPTSASLLYTGPISVNATQTIKAIATKTGYDDSNVTTKIYTFEVAALSIDIDTGTFNNAIDVAITTITSGTSIHYTLDGTAPTALSTLYSGPLHVDGTITLKAIGYKAGYTDSTVATKTYTFVCSTPVIDPDSVGPFLDGTNVSATCDTVGATIRYTINGSDPIVSSDSYAGPVSVLVTTDLRFKAFKSGYTGSSVEGNVYEIKCSLSCDTDAGTFNDIISVSLSTSTFEGEIRYTLNGGTPVIGSTLYTGPLTIDGGLTLKARTFKTGCTSSDIISRDYVFELDQAEFSPPAGTYVGDVELTLSANPTGTVIRYTLDGSVPSGSSTLYSMPFTLTEDVTVKTIATRSGWTSSYSEADYLIKCHAPVFNPPAGGYEGTQLVAITTLTSDASIYYTLDGTTPDSGDTLYTSAISVSCVKTLKAITIKAGHTDSDVTSGLYINILPPTINDGLGGGSSSTLPINIVLIPNECGSDTYYTTDGTAPSAASALYTTPFTISQDTLVRAISYQSNQYSSESQKNYNITIVDPTGTVRMKIRRGLKQLFRNITKTNGFDFNMGHVSGNPMQFDQISQFPSVQMILESEVYPNAQDRTLDQGWRLWRTQTWILEVTTQDINRESLGREAVAGIIQDHIMANPSIPLDGTQEALDCIFEGSNEFGIGDQVPRHVLQIKLRVNYRTRLTNPHIAG